MSDADDATSAERRPVDALMARVLGRLDETARVMERQSLELAATREDALALAATIRSDSSDQTRRALSELAETVGELRPRLDAPDGWDARARLLDALQRSAALARRQMEELETTRSALRDGVEGALDDARSLAQLVDAELETVAESVRQELRGGTAAGARRSGAELVESVRAIATAVEDRGRAPVSRRDDDPVGAADASPRAGSPDAESIAQLVTASLRELLQGAHAELREQLEASLGRVATEAAASAAAALAARRTPAVAARPEQDGAGANGDDARIEARQEAAARNRAALLRAVAMLSVLESLDDVVRSMHARGDELARRRLRELEARAREMARLVGLEEVPTDGHADHAMHEVLGPQTGGGPSGGRIVAVRQRGYMYRGQVLRRAQVEVSGGRAFEVGTRQSVSEARSE